MLRRLSMVLSLALTLLLAGAAGYAAYRVARAQVAEAVYLERLSDLSAEYATLRDRYNEAVRKTAVTELLVEDGRVCVVIRDVDGTVRTVPTPCDPSREVYVDYVVVDGRLWIRRVFDAATPPAEATVIDPRMADVDWDAAGAAHGKAAYRQLEEGRWVVTVTGDGSLGLAKAAGDAAADLAAAPRVKDYQAVERDVAAAVGRIGPAEVLRYVTGG